MPAPAIATTDGAIDLDTIIRVPYLDAVRGIAALLPHVGVRDSNPQVASVHVSDERFIATNRHTVARYRHTGATRQADPLAPSHTADPFSVPHEAAAWLVKQTPKVLGVDARAGARLTVDFIPGTTTTEGRIRVADADGTAISVTTFAPIRGDFPPVWRLLETWEPASRPHTSAIQADLLSMFATSASKLASRAKVDPVLIDLGNDRAHGESGGPARIRIGDRFDGLLNTLKIA